MNRKARRAADKRAERPVVAAKRQAGGVTEPAPARAFCSLGQLLAAEGRLNEAVESFVRAIELESGLWDAHHGLCRCLMAMGQYAPAAAHYEQIIALNADALTFNNLAVARLGAGQADRALDAVCRALALADNLESRAVFVMCMQNAATLPYIPGLPALLMRAMSEPWGRPADMASQCVKLIKADPEIAVFIAGFDADSPRHIPADALLSSPGFAALSGDPLLRCLLVNAPVNDLALERCLTGIRAALLERAATTGELAAPESLGFFGALAQQCFINEYIFAVSEGERLACEQLRTRCISALQAAAPVPAFWLAAFSAYAPIGELGAEAALLGRAWPQPVEAVLTQQLREPAQERALRKTIPALTPIDDRVSVAVQGQYEENPYPRWVKAAPASKPVPLNARLRGQYPFSGFRPLAQAAAPQVLVAGCGTGQQLVDVAQRITAAHVLAIDLSLASLAYARRKTEALGLANIDYGQADILQLASLDRRFEVIDCGGVLHHLGDPLAGWRVLVSLLKPDGVMRIALYSELARRHVVAARNFVAERGHRSSAEGIRRFRRDALALPADAPARLVVQSPDFFTVSALRDLVFHVQEHRFTLPQISAFLDAQGLQFLGFESGPQMLANYSARFPDDRARTDLSCWHRFEQENPWTFGGMYQFWLQKRSA